MPSLKDLTDYIDGEHLKPTVQMKDWICNPNTGEKLQQQMTTGKENVERALTAAAAAHASGEWANTPTLEKIKILNKIADGMMARQDEIAEIESLTTGVTIRLTKFVTVICHLAFRAAAGVLQSGLTASVLPGEHGAVEVLRKPQGVAVLIVPWNAPAPLAAHKIANAIAAGCPAILKPSEWAPNSCDILAEVIESVGLPRGIFQLVHGGADVGAQLVGDPRVRAVSFTGGLNGGRAVAAACAKDFKSLQLELGGNNAMIVLEDADLDLAAQGVVNGMTTLNGQWCRALGRLLVQDSVKDQLMTKVMARLAQVKMGDSMSEASEMGPLVHAGHKRVVNEAAEALIKKGGKVHSSTPLPASLANGSFLAPILISDCKPEDTLEEIFGPVAALHTFKNDREAVTLANQTPYGLAGYVFSKDEERARTIGRQLRTGDVKVNGVGLIGLHPMAPRPAWGLSGFGEEGTEETFRVFCGTSTVGVAARQNDSGGME